ncbi:HIT domain-containing protein [Candidatus Woesearchaeota archaeon]|nr:HIT domain-containing protein [Candidatus Woesearchaeota archaeon]MBT5739712.1 HIT domain-containing protein [Candidatus Woesearchaeota archaeon]
MPNPPELTPEQQKELQEKLKNMSPEELQEFQKQQCIFCQIVSGKIPSKKIYEDEKVIAILDINPAAKGHLLLLPKEHYSIMPQIPDEDLSHLFLIAKQLSKKMLQKMKVAGTSIFIANGLAAGQRAQHFMIHIIPRKQGDGVLPLNEQLQDKEMLQNIKTAVQPKLLNQLGIKQKEPAVEKTPKSQKEEKEEDNDVNLDDIANLFK